MILKLYPKHNYRPAPIWLVFSIERENIVHFKSNMFSLASILFFCFETRFWPERLSSSRPWRAWRAPRTPGTSAGGSVSPAHRSARGWTTCGAFSVSVEFGSGTDDRCVVSRRTVKEQLKKTWLGVSEGETYLHSITLNSNVHEDSLNVYRMT